MMFLYKVVRCFKFKWLLYIIGAAVCIMDAIFLVIKYQRFSVTEKTRVEVQIPLKMPSVTICSNIPIRANYFFRPGISISKHEDRGSLPASDIVLNYLSKFNDTQRFDMGYDTFLNFKICGLRNCQELWFNDLYYGNCVTLNGGMAPEAAAADLKVVGVLLFTYQQVLYADMSRSQSFVAVLHEPDTVPVLTGDIIVGFPGDDIKIFIAKEDYVLKPPPFHSQCVERNSTMEFNRSGFISIPSTPFVYTMENCLQNCLQDLTIRYCKCLLPKIPFQDNANNLSICHQCPRIPKAELKNACGCRKPCRYSTYPTTKISRKSGKFTGREYQKSVSYVKGNETLGEETNLLMNVFGVTRLQVTFTSNVVTVTTEVADYELETMLGSVGGLLGLWMGLSVISIFEVTLSLFRTCSTDNCGKKSLD